MKLIVIILVVTIAACFVVITKASTLKSTKAITKMKTTTPKSTTRKLNVTTTVPRIVTTSKPTTNPAVFSFCRNTGSLASTGKIRLNRTSQTSTSSCVFDIVAPPGQQIQISCSVVSFNSYTGKMAFFDATESDWPQPVLNKIYYSMANTLSVYSDFGGSDGFDCKWKTTPNEKTTKFRLCRHGQASSANGTIQPMAGNSSPRHCSFSIVAPPEYQIHFSCSAVNLTSSDSLFQVAGTTAIFSSLLDLLETNQTYFSTAENEVVIASILGKGDWIDCKWTTLRREKKTNFKLCRDGEATSAIGTITPTGDVKMPSGGCAFVIEAPPDQRIEISCTAVNITNSDSHLTISEIIESALPGTLEPIINEVYHSDSNNKVLVSSQVSQSDWFSCKWVITAKENGTNLQFCRDSEARSAKGTITPSTVHSEETSSCYFSIKAPPGKQIEISCSAIDIDSNFDISGIIDRIDYPRLPVLDRVYYSAPDNFIVLSTQIVSFSDWFNCSWSIVPKPITTNFKLCRDVEITSANGSIQPLLSNSMGNLEDMSSCVFSITALPYQQIIFSCSLINFSAGRLAIYGTLTASYGYEWDPIVNHKYYSIANYLRLEIDIGFEDWFSCKWTTIPKKNGTAKSLARLSP